MRNAIAMMVAAVSVAVVICAWIARRSEKDIAPKVTNFLYALLPPMVGNLLIIVGTVEWVSLTGRYLYACGIDITMYCLLDFTLQYCGMTWMKSWHRITILCVALDIVQLLCNPFFGHAFSPQMEMAYGAPYYNVNSYFGRNLHLGLVYAFMAVVLFILLGKAFRGVRIYSEKYSIMFLLLMFTGCWELFYLFSRTPVKRTVIAYGVFGILVFYFSLYYRPMRLLDHLLADVASGLTDGLFLFDDNGKCVWADEHGLACIGIQEKQVSRSTERLKELFPGLELEKNDWKCQRQLRDRYYNLVKHTVLDSGKRPTGSVLSLQDETESVKELQRERYIANHDSLTGLYTKEYLYQRTRERIQQNPETTFYVAYMDINNFKLVNDIFGNEFGDFTLQCVAGNLRNNLPPGALYGRIGGDAFGFCFSEREFNIGRAEKYMSEFVIDNGTVSHRVVIHEGAYRVTEPEIDVSVMFDRANIALETIKNDYKKHIILYDDEMRDRVLHSQEITLELPGAIRSGQIRPYLQAIVDKTGRVIGAEALARWIHPERGFMPPASFIPCLEQNGMIADVDRHMWRCSAEILKRWAEKLGRDDLFISINISPKDFYFMDVGKELRKIVDETGIPASRLRVEITETMMMEDSSERFETLRELKDAGFVVEMDDFGSGYSSLNMLKNMPVDIIKIDMMFVNDMKEVSRTSTILRNVINMMTELGLVPLTEGIETEEQYELLAKMGCKLFQGYLFAKPMPVEEFEQKFLLGGNESPGD